MVVIKVETLIKNISSLGINTFAGVPDSTLKELCNYLNSDNSDIIHYTLPNEGSAVGIATGVYLATGKPACVYMQNSGIGNAVNPLTSITHADVYNIPILFVIGYRGAPDFADEPQHKFMGKITEKLLDCLDIKYAIIDCDIDEPELEDIFSRAKKFLSENKQFALLIKENTFGTEINISYDNDFVLNREEVLAGIIRNLDDNDIIVSTTGKVSREVYELCNKILGHHDQCFFVIGGMGHASMIAFGIAVNRPGKRVICFDGDGAVLMHMGNPVFIAKQNIKNLIHICLNNDAHESVGGMPTAAGGFSYADMAEACGYASSRKVQTPEELTDFLGDLLNIRESTFVEVMVENNSRASLGRPKETPEENLKRFMDLI